MTNNPNDLEVIAANIASRAVSESRNCYLRFDLAPAYVKAVATPPNGNGAQERPKR